MKNPLRSGNELRSDLIILLSQACELEHSLACSFFYSACSLKQSTDEGVTRHQLELANRWREELFDVARVKLLQFTQVWNLFTAVGCNPYHWRPNFPIPENYYPADLPIELLPFGTMALDRFLQSERSHQSRSPLGSRTHPSVNPSRDAPKYGSVAQIYSVMREIIESIPEQDLLIGKQERQVGPFFPDFTCLVPVVDRSSACQAIDLLRGRVETGADPRDRSSEQSESTLNRTRQYDVLRRLQEEFRAESDRAIQAGERFELVRDVLANPVLAKSVDYRVPIITEPNSDQEIVGRLIQDHYTRDVALLFEQVYSVILGLLQYVFRKSSNDSFALQIFSETAMRMVSRVLKPLAQSLTLLPAGEIWSRQTAGPTFGMSRYVPFHPSPEIAMKSVQTRMKELILRAVKLARDERVPAQLIVAHQNLDDLLTGLREDRATLTADGETNSLTH